MEPSDIRPENADFLRYEVRQPEMNKIPMPGSDRQIRAMVAGFGSSAGAAGGIIFFRLPQHLELRTRNPETSIQ